MDFEIVSEITAVETIASSNLDIPNDRRLACVVRDAIRAVNDYDLLADMRL